MSRLSLIDVARAPPINLNRADPLRASLRSVGWHGKLQKNAISAPSRLRLISQPVGLPRYTITLGEPIEKEVQKSSKGNAGYLFVHYKNHR